MRKWFAVAGGVSILALSTIAVAQLGVSWTPGVYCNPDVNYDRIVGAADVGQVAANWFKTVVGNPDVNPRADINRDGIVSITDLGQIRGNWGRVCNRLWTGDGESNWHAAHPCQGSLFLHNDAGEIMPVESNQCIATLMPEPYSLKCSGSPDPLDDWETGFEPLPQEFVPPHSFCDDEDVVPQ